MRTKSLHTAFKAPAAGIADNFSTEYTYDRNGNVTSMKKAGLLSAVGGEYGQVDNLTMQYEGNQLTRVDDFADDPVYDGAPGFNSPDGEGVRTYDERGNLSSDTSRGITRITYNWQDQPNLITFDNDHRQAIHYDGYGNKTDVSYQTAKWQTINNRPVAHYFTNHTRYYRHGRVILKPHLQSDSLEMTQFDFGYFDAKGKPCYQLHDYRGNVAVVVAASGKVLAHNRYYPYGETITRFNGTHAAAQSNATATAARYRFGAKEHETMHGLNAYDFGPRLLSASLPVWDCPDRQQERYHPLSPYSYCAANPIRYADPSGEVIVGSLSGQIDRLSTEAFKRSKKCDDEILKLIQQLSKPNLTITKIIKIMVKINTSVSKKNEFNAICSEIDQLKKSDQIYETRFTPQSSSDYTSTTIKNKTFEKDGVIILEMQDASYMSLAHELKHAYQFEIGEISFGSRALLYDQTDEVAAYKRESLFGGGSFNENDPMYKDLPKEPRSTKNILNHNPSQEEIDQIRNRGCSFRLNGVTYLSTLARQTE